MSFKFTCSLCNIESVAEEDMIGHSGPCHGCGATVTVFPPSGQLQPPHVGFATLFGAVIGGGLTLVTMLSLRSIPLLISLKGSQTFTMGVFVGELGWTAVSAAMGAAMGALFFGAGAALVETRRSFVILRRGIFIGVAIGSLLGAVIGIVNQTQFGPGNAVPFFLRGEVIANVMLCAGAACGACGGLVSIPLAVNRERRLVRQASFTAPYVEEAKEQPLEDAVVATTEEPPRVELTSQRRQELIRRLGVVHEPSEEDSSPKCE